MKTRFVTTLEINTITDLKIIAAKTHQPVNAVIEKLVSDYKKMGDIK